jgi:tyrosinase
MRFDLAVLSASMASAATLPSFPARDVAVSLPASAFPTFKTVPLEDAKTGKDRKIQGLPDPATNGGSQIGADTTTTAVTAACPANSVHIEWKSYPAADRLKFVQAVKCLMTKPASGSFPPATSRYEDLVRLHQQFMPQVHNSAFFLIWHRYYLWTFEQVLRTECAFTSASE